MRLILQFSRFATIGVLATAAHVSTGLTAHHLLGMVPFTANLLAFAVALCVSFLGQTALAFPGAKRNPQSFSRFTLVAVIGLLLNQAIVIAVTGWLGAPYWAALIVIVATVPPLTFIALKFWALR